MLMQILGAVARREVRAIKRRLAALAFGLTGALFAGLALVFALVALCLWLATRYQPWQAALMVGGLLLAVAFLIWLVGRILARRALRSDAATDAHVQAILDELGLGSKRNEAPFATVSSALAIGFAIGRRLSR